MKKTIKQYTLNFGPQHPAAHGVLRLLLHLEGEQLVFVDPHIGLLHRGTEKLMEQKNYLQALPYFDRLDYVSTMSQEHGYVLAVEKMLGLPISFQASCIRVIFLEMTRILNHLMAVTTHALDLGALTPFLWAFEEREVLMEFYERCSGARLHAAYIRPGGVSRNPPPSVFHELWGFCQKFAHRLDEMEELLSENTIWKQRLLGIGVLSPAMAQQGGFSGVMVRSAGIPYDLRDAAPYEVYDHLPFQLYTSSSGDSLDRYGLRMAEMRESLRLIQAGIALYGEVETSDAWDVAPTLHFKNNMELMIRHFKQFTGTWKSSHDVWAFQAVEAPKGEFGVFVQHRSETQLPSRVRIRAPGFFHLQGLHGLAHRHKLADLVAVIGTLDIVFGEVDR